MTEINDEKNKINSLIFREQLFCFADKTNLSQGWWKSVSLTFRKM